MARTRAFTLIELLVVVAIIVTLLAILLPSMGQAIAVAQEAACRSNLRQIGSATFSYTADHLGELPSRKWQYLTLGGANSAFTTLGKNGSYSGYHLGATEIENRQLNAYLGGPYTGDDEVMIARCPSEESGIRGYEYAGASYTLNSHHAGSTLYEQYRLSDVRSPGRFVAYHETAASWIVDAASIDYATMVWHRPYPATAFSMVFADGHTDLVEVTWGVQYSPEYTFHIDQ